MKTTLKLVALLFAFFQLSCIQSNRKDDYLGTEIDLTVGYKFAKDISINVGYSKMFATETMEILKGGDKGEDNSWS